ncbi:AraC family transcriptional regulator [Leifsonia sp. LS1]|uniref:helix-turn-helix domain-containing protein n=1 Tax=Leifsonia sp. LS1 TaxID=2828483 RepID=UPI001CFE7AA7|nr:AraC family transcriptional regulator [Leifsonia sp. LS1]GIT80901.1 AraC family transcriptional regulator [Leifsonia sp. LS1]
MSLHTTAVPRSKGLLTPSDDEQVRIERVFPGDTAAVLVRHYWLPRWSLAAGRVLRPQVLEYPTANLVVEREGGWLYRANRGRTERTLRGSGWAFGVLLRPGVARAWTGSSLRTAPPSIALRELRVDGTAALVRAVQDAMASGEDHAAVAVVERWLARLEPPDEEARLVDAIVAAVEEDRDLRRVEDVADRFGLGVRHLQRLVAGHIGFGPKWLIQRYRLQEAAAALRSPAPPALAELAAGLGYADQAHFGREFRAVIGSPPGAYAARERAR